MPEKLLSPLIQFVRTLASGKGRPPTLAEAMVDMKLTVYRVRRTEDGQDGLQVAARNRRRSPGQWKILDPVPQTGGGRFFTVNGTEAVDLGLAQGLASSRAELTARYPLRGELLVLEPGAIDTLVQVLNSPWITGLLLVVGLVGLYLEFSSPGIGFGGLLAAVCFVVFFWSHFLGVATWLAAVLFLLGVAFVAVELFILPGFAVAGLVGAILMIASVVLAIQGFFIPQTPQDLAMLTQTILVIFFSGLSFAVRAVVISRRFGSLPIFSRLMLAAARSRLRRVAVPGGLDGRGRRRSSAGMQWMCPSRSAASAWRNRPCDRAARPASETTTSTSSPTATSSPRGAGCGSSGSSATASWCDGVDEE